MYHDKLLGKSVEKTQHCVVQVPRYEHESMGVWILFPSTIQAVLLTLYIKREQILAYASTAHFFCLASRFLFVTYLVMFESR